MLRNKVKKGEGDSEEEKVGREGEVPYNKPGRSVNRKTLGSVQQTVQQTWSYSVNRKTLGSLQQTEQQTRSYS